MPDYRLKANSPNFTMVDGPFARRAYSKGETYQEIPPGEADKFEEIISEDQPAPTRTGKRAGLKTDTDEGGKEPCPETI